MKILLYCFRNQNYIYHAMQKLNTSYNLILHKSSKKLYTGFNFVKGKSQNQINLTNEHFNDELKITKIEYNDEFYINKLKFKKSFEFCNNVFYTCNYIPKYRKDVFNKINETNYKVNPPWIISNVPYYNLIDIINNPILFDIVKTHIFGVYYDFKLCAKPLPNIKLFHYELKLKNIFYFNPPFCYNKKKNHVKI